MQNFTLPKANGQTQPANEMTSLMTENENVVLGTGQTLQTPPTTNDNQLGMAIATYASGGDFYVDSGSAGAYVVAPVGSKKAIWQYQNGCRIRFIPQASNTAASTIDVNSLGIKNIKVYNGATLEDPAAGQIQAGFECQLVYLSSPDAFILMNPYTDTINVNLAVNGGMALATRQAYTIVNNVEKVGLVDGWKGLVSATSVGAGVLTQVTSLAYGTTGCGLAFSGLTTTGSTNVQVRQWETNLNALRVRNKKASFSCIVYQDSGAPINYQFTISKADSLNNFGATTLIAQSSTISVPSGTETLIKFEGVSMGDCANGYEIKLINTPGAVTNKNFITTDVMINPGSFALPFILNSGEQTREECLIRYRKSYNDGISVGTPDAAGAIHCVSGNSTNAGSVYVTIHNPIPMIVLPTTIIYAYTSGAAGFISDAAAGANVSADVADASPKAFSVFNDVNAELNATTDQAFHFEEDTGW